MNSAIKTKRSFVKKLFNLRNRLIVNGKSYINNSRAYTLMEQMKIWMDAYPYATEEQFTKFLKRNYHNLMYLIPGGECKSKTAWVQKLNEFVNV